MPKEVQWFLASEDFETRIPFDSQELAEAHLYDSFLKDEIEMYLVVHIKKAPIDARTKDS